ncbi:MULTISPECIES: hypothetical protein [Paenibacillus]|uniref:Zinc ribbon domain-containing protein n=1 Tax=Paenibacillus campinasensis TaxID=66347 RepID=A0ABW9T7Z0_9BACL|nr:MULTISPECIES: hypothetical protein [Paenibacillus]MUG68757.1 hypothetical protein [Paenibacillus campinasensis]PAK47772.1 hypothetical protein CHH75_24075 [Paenibacillus sp. 7541]
MTCPICRYVTADGKYCEQCGAELRGSHAPQRQEAEAAYAEQAAGIEKSKSDPDRVYYTYNSKESKQSVPQADGKPVQAESGDATMSWPLSRREASQKFEAMDERDDEPNPFFELIKIHARDYFTYFGSSLRRPVATARLTGKDQLLNALLSLVLYVLAVQLLIYCIFILNVGYVPDGAFVNMVLKPMLSLTLFMLLLGVYTYAAVKVSSDSPAGLGDILSRFGTLLTPFIVLCLIGFAFLGLDRTVSALVLVFVLIGSIMIVPTLVLTSSGKARTGSLDFLYVVLLVYVAALLTLMVIGRPILGSLAGTSFFIAG